jgi:hypothetical protein
MKEPAGRRRYADGLGAREERSYALLKARILIGCSDALRWRYEEV